MLGVSLSNPTHRALLIGIVAYSLWATGDTMIKVASDWGASPVHALTLIGLGNTLFLLVFALCTRKIFALRPQHPKPVLLRALITPVMSFGFYTGYTHLPLVKAYAFEFTAPFLVALGGGLFLKEHLSKAQLACIALGFFGGIFALDPAHLFDDPGTLIGYIGVLLGTSCFAAAQLLNRHLASKEDPLAIMIATGATCCVAGLVFSGPSLFDLSFKAVAIGLAASLTSLAGGYLMIVAMRHAKAGIVSSLHYVQMIPGALLGYMIWGHKPTLHVLAGCAIIMAAAFLMAKAKK